MQLIKHKTCSCGRVHVRVPLTSRISNDPVMGGVYWECECKSTLFAPIGDVSWGAVEWCDCQDCEKSEDRCAGDCDQEEECWGCREARIAREELEFESRVAQWGI